MLKRIWEIIKLNCWAAFNREAIRLGNVLKEAEEKFETDYRSIICEEISKAQEDLDSYFVNFDDLPDSHHTEPAMSIFNMSDEDWESYIGAVLDKDIIEEELCGPMGRIIR